MKMKTIFKVLVALAMLSMLTSIFPVGAWLYPDATTAYEKFGPRAKKLLIKMYADDTAEFEALKAGDIDLCDWPLSQSVYDEIVAGYPGLGTCSYGAEFGIYLFDLNCNNNEYLGNPPDGVTPNPVYQNPMSDVWLRRAVGHCVDRPSYIADPSIGSLFGREMYTMMPEAMGKYLLNIYGNTTSPWSWQYSPGAAEAILDAHGFGTFDGEGYRKWDVTGETVVLKFFCRNDHPGRLLMGEKLYAELDAIHIKCIFSPVPSGTGFTQVMVNKDFHIYTGGWNLGSTPDHLILWSWNYYWHPGFCYDYGGFNSPEFNEAADGIMYANTQDEAVYYAMQAQWYQCYEAGSIPVYCLSGTKGYSKTYVGSEEPYSGCNWCGIGNTPGVGIDNGYTFLNMYPEGYPQALADDMTIRWGFKVPEIKQLNGIYASWLYDWNVLGLTYFDSLMASEQYDTSAIYPWTCEDYELSTYTHPKYGECSKVKFTLRDDMFWQDGLPITVADVYFSFVEIKGILEAGGYPPPWWWSNVENILSFSILDAYNFEVLLNVKSFWALQWIGGAIILPKHIWIPICEEGDPQAFQPDPNIIGSGPWRFGEYEESSHVLMYANSPGSVVNTITSPEGYFRYTPMELSCYVTDPPELAHMHKLPYEPAEYTITCNLHSNLAFDAMPLSAELEINGTVEASYGPDAFAPQDTMQILEITGELEAIYVGYSQLHWKGMCGTGECPLSGPENWGCWNLYKWFIFHTHAEVSVTLDEQEPYTATADVTIVAKLTIAFCAPVCLPTVEPCTIIWHDIEWWQFTIKEDIAGSTWYDDVSVIEGLETLADYPYKSELPTCDYKVNMRDIGLAAKGFGSYPGHARWSTTADINGDYKIDMRDIGGIAKKFGWKA